MLRMPFRNGYCFVFVKLSVPRIAVSHPYTRILCMNKVYLHYYIAAKLFSPSNELAIFNTRWRRHCFFWNWELLNHQWKDKGIFYLDNSLINVNVWSSCRLKYLCESLFGGLNKNQLYIHFPLREDTGM